MHKREHTHIDTNAPLPPGVARPLGFCWLGTCQSSLQSDLRARSQQRRWSCVMFPENHTPLARRQHRFHGSSHAQLSPATWLQSVTRPAPSMDKCPGFWATDTPPPPPRCANTDLTRPETLAVSGPGVCLSPHRHSSTSELPFGCILLAKEQLISELCSRGKVTSLSRPRPTDGVRISGQSRRHTG